MGSSRLFNGTSDFINIGSPAVFDDIWSGGGTIGYWGYTTDISAEQNAIGCASSGGYVYGLRGGAGYNYIYVEFTTQFGIWHGTNTSVNNWAYYTCSYNSNSSANNPTFYFNGVSESVTELVTPSGSYRSDASNNKTIGKNNTANYWNGNLAHIQMWDRILSVGEIVESMYKPGSIRPGLVGYWPCMGDSPERDLSGNGNTGTVTGTTISGDGPPITKF